MEQRIVACVGSRFDQPCARALQAFPALAVRFVMAHWLHPLQWQRCSVLWVVDARATLSAVEPDLSKGLPLLIPEQNADLVELCRKARCGIYFQGAAEAVACLTYLLEHEIMGSALGANGRAYAALHACARGAVR